MSALRSRLVRRRVLVAAAVVVVAVAAAAIAILDPFAGTKPSSAGGIDNGAATSLTSVKRRDLSSQTQVSATLGYADASTISVPAGTAPANVQQAQQSAASAQSSLQTAQAALLDDGRTLDQARATLAADRRKQAVDCRGDNAAESGGGAAAGSGGSVGTCAADAQAVAADEQSLTADTAKVAGDQRAVSSAGTALAGANESLATAQSSASIYGQTSVYTMLPAAGRRDQARPGAVRDRRAAGPAAVRRRDAVARIFVRHVARPRRGGAEREPPCARLRAAVGQTRSRQTTAAGIKALQTAHGLAATGQLLLGSVAFQPGAVRVTSVVPTSGAPVQAGPVLAVTSTRRQVTIQLDASQQASVKVGDPVSITLPDNSTTPGHVSYVSAVATAASADQGNGPSSPTVEVDVTPDRPSATGRLDQAPVDVSITTDTVKDVLVVPVTALLALAGGGYAVEEVAAGGVHQLVAVEPGLFDDAEGLVQVSGAGLAAGQRVVVPGS